MEHKDLQVIDALVKKAASNQYYSIASSLADARDKLKNKLNDKWTNSILEKAEASQKGLI
jgi:hypothetical protein